MYSPYIWRVLAQGKKAFRNVDFVFSLNITIITVFLYIVFLYPRSC